MSMSQEEIEALMNGLDIDESESENESTQEEASSDDNSTVSQEELDELVSNSNVEDEKPETEPNNEVEENKAEDTQESTQTVDNDDIDSLLNEIENENSTSEADSASENDKQESSTNSEDMSDDEIESMLSEIDGISDSEPSKEVEKESPKEDTKDTNDDTNSNVDENDIVKNWTDTKINEGVIPLPADKDTKVVNQLNQVANDSEEKVSQIFDVLSLGLDNNNDFRTKITDIEKFMLAQEKLLASLNTKFPNIEVFKKHIAEAKKVNEGLESLKSCMNEEDMKIFEAMELMQFNDINRQKIERVMSVIRKLSLYLNNLFEDEYTEHEIAVAKHIHGDEAEDLIGDDLDKLIEEFGKNN